MSPISGASNVVSLKLDESVLEAYSGEVRTVCMAWIRLDLCHGQFFQFIYGTIRAGFTFDQMLVIIFTVRKALLAHQELPLLDFNVSMQ